MNLKIKTVNSGYSWPDYEIEDEMGNLVTNVIGADRDWETFHMRHKY